MGNEKDAGCEINKVHGDRRQLQLSKCHRSGFVEINIIGLPDRTAARHVKPTMHRSCISEEGTRDSQKRIYRDAGHVR